MIQALELVYRELEPTLGNVQSGWLKPMVNRAFNMMFRADAFLPVPEVLAGANLDIEYEGPLARAQRTGDITALQTALALSAGVAQMDPQAVDNIDSDEVIRFGLVEIVGLPMHYRNAVFANSQIIRAIGQRFKRALQAAIKIFSR